MIKFGVNLYYERQHQNCPEKVAAIIAMSNEMQHKYILGQEVCVKTVNKQPIGTVVAQERSYGWPTYQVKIGSETLTLCESDLANIVNS